MLGFEYRLIHANGEPADPRTLESSAPTWRVRLMLRRRARRSLYRLPLSRLLRRVFAAHRLVNRIPMA
jgi:hypothetical protein